MSSAVLKKTEDSALFKLTTTSSTTKEKIENTSTDELIIGICSPIGSNRDYVIEAIKKRLTDYNYEIEYIKVSDFIETYYDVSPNSEVGKTPAYSNLMWKIEGGDNLRTKYNNKSILIELAIKQIREERKIKKTTDATSRRKCYIIDSLKNYEELKLLQSIYGDIFYLFSIFSPEEERKENLRNNGLSNDEIKSIMASDEYENDLFGQNVRDTFINGDIFIRSSKVNKKSLHERINRYMHLIFDTKIITPNSDEEAMYNAKSSAGNSACLSRQVGATITDENGVTIARGWNDVPKFGGNLYTDTDNKRCKDLGYCSNVTHRTGILDNIEEEIGKALAQNSKDIKNVMDIIKKSKFKNIIEYSRSIHAEMHAIIIGSQMTNNKMVGGNLYCTTYPCHNCARHIILAGIKNIYYIEPYKKSLGMTLHSDALTEDESDNKKVRILAYDGVSPRKYLNFFSMKEERKNKDGKIIKQDIKIARPKSRISLQAIPTLENQAIHALVECGLIKEEGAENGEN
ncbi:anti-phage dCTP deaminase [Arcobacter sp. F2176]|uniref:anti-phage dCTP deaminase n=1 Tax=Arcobacter sp. F2176 TaxID=2044511 RepID=UPI00100A2ED4|nr:anti-phage dCTP deaminase [Arcobacter sp. F2176]RXJ79486.1 deoxycytidylate deaminase [Arcobacter sp. F2176]